MLNSRPYGRDIPDIYLSKHIPALVKGCNDCMPCDLDLERETEIQSLTQFVSCGGGGRGVCFWIANCDWDGGVHLGMTMGCQVEQLHIIHILHADGCCTMLDNDVHPMCTRRSIEEVRSAMPCCMTSQATSMLLT